MRVRLFSVLIGCLFILSVFSLTVAGDKKEAKHEYIGAKKCKMCHKKDGIFDSWMKTKHATAWDGLTDEQKKDEALKPFYTTGINKKGELLTGVQCEACHGPGSDFKKKSIMQDREKAIANGLIIPDEKTCLKCHNADAPTKTLAATAKDFSFKKMKVTGVHALSEKGKTETKEK